MLVSPVKKEESTFLIDSDSKILSSIKNPDLNLSLWQRDGNPLIYDYIQKADRSLWDNLEIRIKSDEISYLDGFEELLPGSVDDPGKAALIKDIKLLAKLFFEVEHGEAKVSLEIIEYDMCKLFHVDKLKLRLLCTYCGEGTEWVPNSHINRKGLGKGCNKNIVIDDRAVRKFSPFDVGMLKGEIFPGNLNNGIVHRSPSIENTQQPWRVLLKIDSVKEDS